jgi:dolichyl-phosphate beta-glucosyltransferase
VRKQCTVVVPCYNEATRLPVEQFRSFIARCDQIGFVFVDDGSKDNTIAVLERVRGGFEESVTILRQKVNTGKAEAVRTGLLYALQTGSPVIGFWDADLATPLEAIPDLLDIIAQPTPIQMVFGARVQLLGRKIVRKPARHYIGRVFATVVSSILRLPVYDTQCGAKLFRATAEVNRILEQPFVSKWVFDVELIARFIHLHKGNVDYVRSAIYEFPLKEWSDVDGSKLRGNDFLKAAVDVFTIYRRYLQ